MASLKDYFYTDFDSCMGMIDNFVIKAHDELKKLAWEVEVHRKIHFDFEAHAKCLSYYLPGDNYVLLCKHFIDDSDSAYKWMGSDEEIIVESEPEFPTDRSKSSTQLVDTKQRIFYIDTEVPRSHKDGIMEYASQKGLFVEIRDKCYAEEKSKIEKPLAFISHDSRDKEHIARPLAIELKNIACPVWFDEFSLKLGSSLRESIERGIKECKKCVLVLTPNFLTNEGWTKREFNSIFTREMIEKERLVLPVWAGVTAQEVYQYSPSLADTFASDWNEGVASVARKIKAAISVRNE